MTSGTDLAARVAELEAEVRRLRHATSIPYRAIIEDMSELVVRWKPDGTRLFVNDAYCRLFDASREDLIGTTFWPLITEADRARVRERLASLTPDKPVITGRHRAAAAGRVVWMEWVDRAVYDAEGQLVELQSVGRDITERVEFEEQARRVARGDAAARATAAIAHDLRNVLQVIQGVTSLLEDSSEDGFEATRLKSAVDAGKRLLTQLGQLSHGLVLQPCAVELSQRVLALKGLLTELTHDNVTLVTRFSPVPCTILGDPTQIDQVLMNLVRNAAEAMPGGGTVCIETATAAMTSLDGHSQELSDCAVLRVVDDGPGISESVLPRVFDPRITTKVNGQGLGLATVKAIVEGHRGKV
ncbi:MAG TPA: PAS domain S-box protein, partial [Polyangiaceae bacterium]|nr:PAS domain S-box protein [Polyangiaceae bacterium]